MRLDEVRFFHDQLFIKKPGTLAPTQWHNDQPFWPFNGNQFASIWMASTSLTMTTSKLFYVVASHKGEKLFCAITPGEDPAFIEENLELYPDFHDEFGIPEYRFLSWNMEPRDVIVHHPLTVHGTSKTPRRPAAGCILLPLLWRRYRLMGTCYRISGAGHHRSRSGRIGQMTDRR